MSISTTSSLSNGDFSNLDHNDDDDQTTTIDAYEQESLSSDGNDQDSLPTSSDDEEQLRRSSQSRRRSIQKSMGRSSGNKRRSSSPSAARRRPSSAKQFSPTRNAIDIVQELHPRSPSGTHLGVSTDFSQQRRFSKSPMSPSQSQQMWRTTHNTVGSPLGGTTGVDPLLLETSFSSPSEKAFANPSSSKAVIGALKSLQQKIRKLEQERDYYKQNFENERSHRENLEKQFTDEKIALMRERDELTVENNRLDSTLNRVQDRLSATEKESKYFKTLSDRTDTERKTQTVRLTELEKTHTKYDMRIQQLEANLQQQNETVVSQQQKIEDLQRALVRERRRKERAEADKQKIDKALKELITIHSDLVATNGSGPTKKKKSTKKGTTKSSGASSARGLSARASSAKSGKGRSRKGSMSRKRVDIDVPFLGGGMNPSFNVNAMTSNAMSRGYIDGTRYESPLERDHTTTTAEYHQDHHTSPLRKEKKRGISAGKGVHHHHHGDLFSDVNLDKPIEKVIKGLKEERTSLQKEYNVALDRLQAGETSLSEQIHLLYHHVQRKSTQIHLLKKYKAQIDARLEPARVPGAERKVKIMKLYRELQQLSGQSSIVV
mmetsp:Transcript_5303/g.19826  ORF Transcript_5303/g.19826 Transcript_5303/m.19826 type:complete len:605 (-) Transcript_5303:1405-3219(-)